MPRLPRNSSTKAAAQACESITPATKLPPSSTNPPFLFILPENRSPESRIITLQDPVSAKAGRYFVDPEKGIYAFTRVSSLPKFPTSWLLAPSETVARNRENSTEGPEQNIAGGYTVEKPDLFIATPFDPIFILLPVVVPSADGEQKLFRAIEDYLEDLVVTSKHAEMLLRHQNLRDMFEQRAAAVCDHVDVGDEKMYRFSALRCLKELQLKAERMVTSGLPASLEAAFVKEPLEVPVTNVLPVDPVAESQSTEISAESEDAGDPSQRPVEPSADNLPSTYNAPDNVVHLLRVRTAMNFILASYVDPAIRRLLESTLSSTSFDLDFGPLDAHLECLVAKRKEAQALRSISDNISRKRSHAVDDEAEQIRAEKKRKKEEDDARKKSESRAIKQLSKADTSGMKKLSSFFAKAPPKKAAK